MIAWGPGSFENEEGTDWLDDLIDSGELEAIILALRTVAEFAGSEELDATGCCPAIVAAEIVAAAHGKPHREVPERITDFIEEHDLAVSENVVGLARSSIASIMRQPGARTHWKSEGMLDEWLNEMEDLEKRLT